MSIRIKDKLFFRVKNGQNSGEVTVIGCFDNNKEIREYGERFACRVRPFRNKRGDKKLFKGDKVSYFTAVNNYKMRI